MKFRFHTQRFFVKTVKFFWLYLEILPFTPGHPTDKLYIGLCTIYIPGAQDFEMI